jgi:hypothetical protein
VKTHCTLLLKERFEVEGVVKRPKIVAELH